MNTNELRQIWGRAYITEINSWLVIPWKKLTIAEYQHYEYESSIGIISNSVLENEIFDKCVLSKELIEKKDELPAGAISSVVYNIMQLSGPQTVEELDIVLEKKRIEAKTPIHEMAAIVCKAFPAYKLEDVYELDFDTFMLRVAQAENILMSVGILQHPISFSEKRPLTKKEKLKAKLNSKNAPTELKNAWERQNVPANSAPSEKKQTPVAPPIQLPKEAPKDRRPIIYNQKQEVSPVLDINNQVILNKGLNEARLDIENKLNINPMDDDRARDEMQFMLKQGTLIYSDIIKKLPYYNKKDK